MTRRCEAVSTSPRPMTAVIWDIDDTLVNTAPSYLTY